MTAFVCIGWVACAEEGAKVGDGSSPVDATSALDAGGGDDLSTGGGDPDLFGADFEGVDLVGVASDLSASGAPVAVFVPTPPAYWYVDATPFSVNVGGAGVTHYVYRLDTDAAWSDEQSVATPIVRSIVAPGQRTIELRGRDASGTWQDAPTSATFFMATVDHAAIPCVQKTANNGALCDLVITPSSSYRSYRTNEHPLPAPTCSGDNWGTQITNPGPGAVICLANGTHRGIVFSGLEGSADKPITITNCGGVASFVAQSTDYGSVLKLNYSKYVRIVGTGSAEDYGITVDASATATDSTNAIEATCGASDYEIAYVEIKGSSYAGISARTNISCSFHRDNFVQANTFLHHNYVHDTHGEGFYVGGSHWAYAPPSTAGGCDHTQCKCGCICDGQIRLEAELHGVRVHHNLVEDTDADAIQVGSASENNAIYGNVVHRALQGTSGFNSGALSINAGTRGVVMGNLVTDSEFGAAIGGPGDVLFANNIIVGPATDARTCLQILSAASLPGTGFHIINNTFVGCGNEGIYMYNVNSVGNVAYNNFILGATTPIQFNGPAANYDWVSANNITGANSLATTYFASPGTGDYCTLLPSTNAIGTGNDAAASFGVVADYRGEPRSLGAYDVGACGH